MLDLKNISLWACVWSPSEQWIERTFRAVRYCTNLAEFGEVVFFCYSDPRIDSNCGWRIVRIPQLNMDRWNVFINREVPNYLTKAYALSVHEDGFILDTSLWSEEFLGFDYIGAPWPNGVVGNQGFCIESRRMMNAKVRLPKSYKDPSIPSDNFICVYHRKRLERMGIRFAPKSLAERFSTEMYGDGWPSFGFHGRNHSVRKYSLGWNKIEQMESSLGLS